jgi:hypothetical protein
VFGFASFPPYKIPLVHILCVKIVRTSFLVKIVLVEIFLLYAIMLSCETATDMPENTNGCAKQAIFTNLNRTWGDTVCPKSGVLLPPDGRDSAGSTHESFHLYRSVAKRFCNFREP